MFFQFLNHCDYLLVIYVFLCTIITEHFYALMFCNNVLCSLFQCLCILRCISLSLLVLFLQHYFLIIFTAAAAILSWFDC